MVVNYYMRRKNISFELQGRVRKYLEYTMQKEKNSEEESKILKNLTNVLRNELTLESNRMLHQIPFFTSNFSKDFIEELSFCLKEIKLSPEEFVYQVLNYICNFVFILFLKSFKFWITVLCIFWIKEM